MPFKPSFLSRWRSGLNFLRFFLAEYTRSEAFFSLAGRAVETPAGVEGLEVDEEADPLSSPGCSRKNFLSNPYFFNKTFFFFCFF